jgi:hypothetical protein
MITFKNLKSRINLILLSIFGIISGSAHSQNEFHPTISKIELSYTPVSPPNNVDPNSFQAGLYGISQATITLKSINDVNKIYFKILDLENDNAIVYQVDYLINTATTINASGITLFENINGTIRISSGQAVCFKPNTHTYQIITEDSQQNISPIFFETQ